MDTGFLCSVHELSFSLYQQGLTEGHTLLILLTLTLKVLVTTIDAQWEGMGDVGSARYEPALLPPCPTIRALSCSIINCPRSTHSISG